MSEVPLQYHQHSRTGRGAPTEAFQVADFDGCALKDWKVSNTRLRGAVRRNAPPVSGALLGKSVSAVP